MPIKVPTTPYAERIEDPFGPGRWPSPPPQPTPIAPKKPKAISVREITVGTTGKGTEISQIVVFRPTIDPASVAANSISAQTFTVKGLSTSDSVEVNPGVNTIGVAGAYVSAANTLTVIFVNPTASAINPASSIWKVTATRS